MFECTVMIRKRGAASSRRPSFPTLMALAEKGLPDPRLDHGPHTTDTPFVMLKPLPHGPPLFRYTVW